MSTLTVVMSVAISPVLGAANAETFQSAPGQFYPTRGRALDNVEIAAGSTSTVRVVGIGVVPWSGVASVALNVAAKGSAGTGSVAVYPSGGTEPGTSAVSYRKEVYAANLVTVKTGSDGNVKVTNKGTGSVRVYLDIHGYTLTQAGSAPGSTYVPVAPTVIADAVTIPANGNHELQPLGKGGVPTSNVEALAYTLRAKATSNGTLRTYPAGDVWPADATIDYADGLPSQNFAITKIGAAGKINIHNLGFSSVKIWVDVAGYFTKNNPTGPTLRSLQPARLTTQASIAAGSTYTLAPLGNGGVPASGVDAVSVSLTARSTSAGALVSYPSGTTAPTTQTVGFNANVPVTTSTAAKLGADGAVSVRNTGSAAATVSIDLYGYFRKGLALTELTATPSDHEWPEGVRVNDTTPALSASATNSAGPVTFTFEVAPALSDTPVASGTAAAVSEGRPATWTVPAGRLTNPGAFRFRVKADDGVDAVWSVWKWLAVDSPLPATALSTGLEDPEAPILSGTVTRPSNGPVTGRLYLFDSAGHQVGGSPLGNGTVQGGQRLSLQLPDGLVQPGQRYQWQMDACVGAACTLRSALTSFTVPNSPPSPATRTLTLAPDKVSMSIARVGLQACGGSACPLTDDTAVRVGGTSADTRLSLVKLDLGSVPAGARVSGVTINLGTPSCGSNCPGTVSLSAYQLTERLSAQPTGAEAEEKLLPDAVATATNLSDVKLDIGDLAAVWQRPDENDGVVLRTQEQDLPEIAFAKSSITATVTYLPAGPPGSVEGALAVGGDGAALISWSPPSDEGAAGRVANDEDGTETSAIADYQIEVLSPDGQVLRTITSAITQAKVPNLTNGTSYQFRVRARSADGIGPWVNTSTVTPQAIPYGANMFMTAVQEYLGRQDDIMERRFDTAGAAADASSLGATFRALLTTTAAQMIQTRDTAAANKAVQVSTSATYPDAFVGYSAETGTVTVHAEIEGQTVYANDFGTATEERVTNEFNQEGTFTFAVPGGAGVTTARSIQAAAPQEPTLTVIDADDSPMSTEINAYTPEQDQDRPKPPESAFLDPAVTGGVERPGMTARAAAGINSGGIASWAVRNAKTYKQEYYQNCTNFVSKAINRGGGARKISGWYRSKKVWWENSLNDSFTWAGAENNMQHFTAVKFGRRGTRAIWEPSWTAVWRGDTIYFRRSKGANIGHVAIVSKKTANSVYGIYMAQQNRVNRKPHGDTYKPLWKVYWDYKGGVGFAWVSW